MNRRTTLVLTGVALLGFAAATLPDLGFAQSNPLIGTWKLNLDKSKFSPGTAPRSGTLNYQQDGQNFRITGQFTDAQGRSRTTAFTYIYDGQPHPNTGDSAVDASAATLVDANTIIFGRFKDGKLIAVGTNVVSPDGKAMTVNTTGTGSTLPSATGITVWDKQ
jgi:hypothetical protein